MKLGIVKSGDRIWQMRPTSTYQGNLFPPGTISIPFGVAAASV